MSDRRLWLGIGLAVVSAIAFSLTSASAVLAYRADVTPTSVITIRFVGAIVLLAVLLKLSGARLLLPSPQRWNALAIGVLLAVQSYWLYQSFAYIPIALTMTIFYIYPIVVGVTASITGDERLTMPLGIGLISAFIGLVLVFDVTGKGLNTAGAVYAVLAALGWSAITILTARVMTGGDARAVSLHMQVSAGAIFLVLCIVLGDVTLPTNTLGWVGFLGMPITYAIAITAFFGSVAVLGSVRASLFMNFEPVWTILAGFLILGQTLTPLQLLGAAFVVAALFAVRSGGLRRPQPET